MKKLLLLFSILLIANTFTSCKKEKEEEPKPSKAELLTAHEWLGIDLVTYTDGTQTDFDDMSEFSLLFGTNNDFFNYDNGELSSYGKWQLIDGSPDILRLYNTHSVTVTLPDPMLYDYFQSDKSVNNTHTDWNIEELTKDKLTLYIEGDVNGEHIKLVFHFKK